LTKVPIYGELRAKLQPTTQALFEQKNFKDTKILEDLYNHANTFGMGRVKDYSEFFTGIDLKPAVLLNNFNVSSTLFDSLKIDSFRCKSNDDGRKSPCLLLDIKQDLKLSLFAPSSLPRCYSFQLC